MVKKITVNCSFSGSQQPVTFYIGDSAVEKNPIGFQSKWLDETKGGSVPSKLMDSLVKIKAISDEHQIPFEDLYDHVIKEIESGKTLQDVNISNQEKTKAIKESEAQDLDPDEEVSKEVKEEDVEVKEVVQENIQAVINKEDDDEDEEDEEDDEEDEEDDEEDEEDEEDDEDDDDDEDDEDEEDEEDEDDDEDDDEEDEEDEEDEDEYDYDEDDEDDEDEHDEEGDNNIKEESKEIKSE